MKTNTLYWVFGIVGLAALGFAAWYFWVRDASKPESAPVPVPEKKADTIVTEADIDAKISEEFPKIAIDEAAYHTTMYIDGTGVLPVNGYLFGQKEIENHYIKDWIISSYGSETMGIFKADADPTDNIFEVMNAPAVMATLPPFELVNGPDGTADAWVSVKKWINSIPDVKVLAPLFKGRIRDDFTAALKSFLQHGMAYWYFGSNRSDRNTQRVRKWYAQRYAKRVIEGFEAQNRIVPTELKLAYGYWDAVQGRQWLTYFDTLSPNDKAYFKKLYGECAKWVLKGSIGPDDWKMMTPAEIACVREKMDMQPDEVLDPNDDHVLTFGQAQGIAGVMLGSIPNQPTYSSSATG